MIDSFCTPPSDRERLSRAGEKIRHPQWRKDAAAEIYEKVRSGGYSEDIIAQIIKKWCPKI